MKDWNSEFRAHMNIIENYILEALLKNEETFDTIMLMSIKNAYDSLRNLTNIKKNVVRAQIDLFKKTILFFADKTQDGQFEFQEDAEKSLGNTLEDNKYVEKMRMAIFELIQESKVYIDKEGSDRSGNIVIKLI